MGAREPPNLCTGSDRPAPAEAAAPGAAAPARSGSPGPSHPPRSAPLGLSSARPPGRKPSLLPSPAKRL